MPPRITEQIQVDGTSAGTVLSIIRRMLPGTSWSAARRLLAARRIAINGVLCPDEGRRVTPGETVAVLRDPLPPPPRDDDVRLLWLDQWLLVVEKPAGMITLRHPEESAWPPTRRDLQPTLDECATRMVQKLYVRSRDRKLQPLLSIHRLDRDTSGLLVFARDQETQEKLIQQFVSHQAIRRYLCVIPGKLADQTIRTQLVRNRGDGLRGSAPAGNSPASSEPAGNSPASSEPAGSVPASSESVGSVSVGSVSVGSVSVGSVSVGSVSVASIGKEAITHIRTLQHADGYSQLECRLETGRTNQIRIHLAELGHPVCGDCRYRGLPGSPEIADHSGAPRLALHAAVLGFSHPQTREDVLLESAWPVAMHPFLQQHRLDSGISPGTDTE